MWHRMYAGAQIKWAGKIIKRHTQRARQTAALIKPKTRNTRRLTEYTRKKKRSYSYSWHIGGGTKKERQQRRQPQQLQPQKEAGDTHDKRAPSITQTVQTFRRSFVATPQQQRLSVPEKILRQATAHARVKCAFFGTPRLGSASKRGVILHANMKPRVSVLGRD